MGGRERHIEQASARDDMRNVFTLGQRRNCMRVGVAAHTQIEEGCLRLFENAITTIYRIIWILPRRFRATCLFAKIADWIE